MHRFRAVDRASWLCPQASGGSVVRETAGAAALAAAVYFGQPRRVVAVSAGRPG